MSISNYQMKMISHYVSNNSQTWVPICRKLLLDMESRNIQTRALFWTKFVNDSTMKTISKLYITLNQYNIEYTNYDTFRFKISNTLKYLLWLRDWQGLR
eukprot:899165_1